MKSCVLLLCEWVKRQCDANIKNFTTFSIFLQSTYFLYKRSVGQLADCHDDVIKRNHFPRCWPFVRGIHRSPVNSRTKACDAELWCFLWSAPEKRLSKHSWGLWFETFSRPLRRHSNVLCFSTQGQTQTYDQYILTEWHLNPISLCLLCAHGQGVSLLFDFNIRIQTRNHTIRRVYSECWYKLGIWVCYVGLKENKTSNVVGVLLSEIWKLDWQG